MPINFRPLRDLILVLPDPAPDKIGSIAIPQGAAPQGHRPADDPTDFMGVKQRTGDARDTFTGTVVSVGPGDRIRERVVNGRVVRTLAMKDGSCAPMRTKVGDRLLYPRRASSPAGYDLETGNCDLYIDGVGYLLFHEEQSAFAILEA
jgi:hypothetical protein